MKIKVEIQGSWYKPIERIFDGQEVKDKTK